MKQFSEQKHHALMAALICRQVCLQRPKNSPEIVRKVVSDYGTFRGRLVRDNVLSMGDALTVTNYMAYKSLHYLPGTFIDNVIDNDPDLITQVIKCCSMEILKKHGLADYGKMHCKYCDAAMIKAYNSDIAVEIPQQMEQDGSDSCIFVWRGFQVNYQELKDKKKQLGDRFVLTWQQLTHHLVSCAKASLDEIEEGLSDRIVTAALMEFEALPDSE